MGPTNCDGGENGVNFSSAMSGWMVIIGRVRVVLSKRVSVGREGQVSWLTNRLSSNKWLTDHLDCDMAGDSN